MSDTGTAEATATASEHAVAMTGDDLTALLEKGVQGEPTESEEEQPPPEAEQPPAPEAEPEVEQEPESGEIDQYVSSLDDEQAKELATKLGGRLGSELGRMRAELRELKTERATEAEKRSPFDKKESTPNPYANETDLKSLEDTYDTAAAVVQDGERILRRYRNADPDEEVEYGDRTLTILQIEDMVETARAARETHIPERVRQLRESEGLESARLQNFAAVKEMHPWLEESGELKDAFESVRDKYLPSVRDHIPDILPYFDTMLADHFAAVQQRQSPAKDPDPKTPPRRPAKKPPGSPGGSAAASARPASSSEKRSKMLERFTSGGQSMSGDDLAQFLATK